MKEFWLWVAIVTLILFLLFATTLGFVYTHKQIKKAEAILLRAEQLEKDKKSDKRKKDPDEE
jgi:phosphotransferase system  glucose/maltose/N-acetylglucosamine-specific IIC component